MKTFPWCRLTPDGDGKRITYHEPEPCPDATLREIHPAHDWGRFDQGADAFYHCPGFSETDQKVYDLTNTWEAITAIRVHPGDRLVFLHPQTISVQVVRAIEEKLAPIFPGIDVKVLPGMTGVIHMPRSESR